MDSLTHTAHLPLPCLFRANKEVAEGLLRSKTRSVAVITSKHVGHSYHRGRGYGHSYFVDMSYSAKRTEIFCGKIFEGDVTLRKINTTKKVHVNLFTRIFPKLQYTLGEGQSRAS